MGRGRGERGGGGEEGGGEKEEGRRGEREKEKREKSRLHSVLSEPDALIGERSEPLSGHVNGSSRYIYVYVRHG